MYIVAGNWPNKEIGKYIKHHNYLDVSKNEMTLRHFTNEVFGV